MPENEFEKQVQRKMDEFRLRPSEPVWAKIRDEIKDKRRRRLLILIPSLLAASLLFGWFGYQRFYADNKTENFQSKTTTNKNTTADKLKEDRSIEELTGIKEENRDKQIETATSEKDAIENKQQPAEKEKNNIAGKTTRPENKNVTPLKTTVPEVKNDNKTDHRKTVARSVKNRNYIAKNNNNNAVTENEVALIHKEQTVDSRGATGNDIAFENTGNADRLQMDNVPVVINNELKIFPATDAGIAKKDEPAINELPVIKGALSKFSPRMKWGLVLSGGIASRTKQPFNFTSAEKAQAFYAANPNFSVGNVSGGILILPPSDVKPGAAFKAGVAIDKPISKRFAVSAALQYAYSSDHITIGNDVNSANGNSVVLDRNNLAIVQAQTPYSNANSKNRNYTNKYHFIELPVTVQYTINRNWKNPFVWNAGVSLSRLLSTNALLYDIAWGGVYYEGKSDIKKTQFNVSTGFTWRFIGANRWQWDIGPQISMNTSKLFDGSHDSNKHPVYGGLGLRLLFPGKKKF